MSKIRLLHLFNSYLPQSENWAFKLIRHTPGIEVHIGARHFLKNDFYAPEFHFVDNDYDAFGKLNRKLSKKKPLDLLKKVLIKSIPFFFGTYRQTLIRYVKTHQIDSIHCHFADVGWQFLEVAEKTGRPLVVSFYGWDYEMLPFTKTEYLRRYKILFEKAAAFICEGKHGMEILKRMRCPAEKLYQVPLGVRPEKIPVHKRSKNRNELRLIQIASFTEKKGHMYTVKAFERALKNCPDLQLTLVGDAREPGIKEKVKAYILRHGLENKIELLDFVGHHRLYDFLKKFQVFIHPSCYTPLNDCEGGAPIVLLDAQATGMPVISTNHCDIPEEVIHKKTGLLSPEKEVEPLARHIQTFYEMDNETFQVYARNARAHVEQFFDISKNARNLKAVYRQVLLDW